MNSLPIPFYALRPLCAPGEWKEREGREREQSTCSGKGEEKGRKEASWRKISHENTELPVRNRSLAPLFGVCEFARLMERAVRVRIVITRVRVHDLCPNLLLCVQNLAEQEILVTPTRQEAGHVLLSLIVRYETASIPARLLSGGRSPF